MRRALAAVPTLLALLAGCSGPEPEPPRSPSPFVTCPASVSDSGELTLPCFTGDTPVAPLGLGKPAVINLWASWCGPCRLEMPAFQAFADEAGDTIQVLGVDTGDPWEGAVAWGGELGITYPQLFDPDQTLKAQLGVPALPATIFVDADGTVRHTDLSGALTLEQLRALAAEYLA